MGATAICVNVVVPPITTSPRSLEGMSSLQDGSQGRPCISWRAWGLLALKLGESLQQGRGVLGIQVQGNKERLECESLCVPKLLLLWHMAVGFYLFRDERTVS